MNSSPSNPSKKWYYMPQSPKWIKSYIFKKIQDGGLRHLGFSWKYRNGCARCNQTKRLKLLPTPPNIKIYDLVVLGWVKMCRITISVQYCWLRKFSSLCTFLYSTVNKSQTVWDIDIIQIALCAQLHWACIQAISSFWS